MLQEFKPFLRNYKFLYLWLSQILSQVTVHMMNFLLLTRLFSVTGSSIATSLLWVSYALPAIFFGPIGAASVDLISRRRILMITNLLQALTIFAFIFTHQSSVFLLYTVVLLYSFFNQFYVPAESASLPSVVSKKSLPHANSLFFITQQGALVLGFGLAGPVQKLLGFEGSLILCAAFLFAAFVSVAFLPELPAAKKIPGSLEKLLVTFFKSIYEGYVFIRSHKMVLFPLFLLLGTQISLTMIVVSLPVIAEQVLGVAISYAGLLVVVPAAFGAILGSIFIPKYLKKGMRKKAMIEYGLIVLAAAVFLMVFATPFLAILPRVILGPVFVAFAGLGYVAVNIPTLTYLQEATPVWLRGRVFGNFWFLVTVATIFPVLLSGIITEFFGVKYILTLFIAALVFAFVYAKNMGQKLIEEHFEVQKP